MHTSGRWARGGRALALAAAVAVPAAAAGADAPAWLPAKPGRYATDATGRLDAARISALNEKLAAFERETSTQVLVYVAGRVPPGTTLEEFANKAFGAWGIGQKGKDNGVLFAVFLDDRVMRIEVGYGLEGVLPDARAYQITEELVKPHFKSGDVMGGLEEGAAGILAAARGEPFTGSGRTVAEAAFPVNAVATVVGFGLFILVLGVSRTYREGWLRCLCTGIGLGSFFAGVGLVMVAMVFAQGRVVRLALLAGGLFVTTRIVEMTEQDWKAGRKAPAAARISRRLAIVIAALLPLGAPLLPWPLLNSTVWMAVAAWSAVLLLLLAANAIEDSGLTRLRGVVWPLCYIAGLGLAPYVWDRLMKSSEFPQGHLWAMGACAFVGTMIRPGGLDWARGGGSGGGRSGGSSSGYSGGSSSSSSSSSYSGGGGSSGGGGASNNW